MALKPGGESYGPTAARRIVPHICAGCGVTFEGIKLQRYHSRACQVKAYRRRLKEAKTEAQG